jgi:hypothetical protein
MIVKMRFKKLYQEIPQLGSIQTNLDTPQSELSLLKNYIR